MSQTAAPGGGDRAWRYAVRALVSLPVTVGLLYWLLFSVFLAAFTCGDNCDGGEAEHWRYPAQLVIAALGSLLGVVAMVLGFTSKAPAYRLCLIGSSCCALVWVVWVMLGGSF